MIDRMELVREAKERDHPNAHADACFTGYVCECGTGFETEIAIRRHFDGCNQAGEHSCMECGEKLEETPDFVPGLYCPNCNRLW